MDLDSPLYTIAESTMIAGQVAVTGRSWFENKWLTSATDPVKPGRKGIPTLVSGRTVLAHTIAAEAVEIFKHPALACAAARQFTDFADPLEAPGHFREPGRLFAGAFTYLAIYPDKDAKVLRVKGSLEDVLLGNGKRKCCLLALDFIVKHVEVELQKIDAERRQ